MGCAASNQNGEQQSSYNFGRDLQGSFALPQQQAPPNDIQSIQLYPEGQSGQAPVIKLDSQQKLVLSFDYLGSQSRQFRVEVSHWDQEWKQSPISPSTYLDSFFQTYIQEAKSSFTQNPSYKHVEYVFPNNELRPVVSGNYLLEIYSYQGGELLFSLPFFITENEGSIQTRVERLFAQHDDGRPLDQLFSTYQYPDFVEYPQFDLSISFVQNRFWGRMKTAGFLDTITPGELQGYIERNNAYVGNYEFKFLDLSTFDVDGQEILEYQPGVTPPKIILRRDIQHLDTNPRLPSVVSTLGLPNDDRGSNYAQVEFSLETDASISPSDDIYIVGHFNNWMINDFNKMQYNSAQRMWKGRAFIKQGQYGYKYVLAENNNIKDLRLDQSFLSTEQEYLSFIYFKDPKRNFDRLLKVDRIIKR
jgi:hypothetical protein